MSADKLYNLKVSSGAQAARFVVNLKPGAAEKIETKLEKLAEVDYGSMAREKYSVWDEKFKGFLAHARNDINRIAGMTKTLAPAKIEKLSQKTKASIIDQLAFVGLFKVIFLIIYKICYGLGWLIMYIFRLAFLILAAIFKPLLPLINRWSVNTHQYFFRLVKDLPAGTQIKQAVAASLTAKLIIKTKKLKAEKIVPAAGNMAAGSFFRAFLKPVLIFAAALIVLVLPLKAFSFYLSLDGIKGRVMGASEAAVNELISGGQAAAGLNFIAADKSFSAAADSFLNAQNQLQEIDGLIFTLASLAPDNNLRLAAAGKTILRAGELSSRAGKSLSLAMSSLFEKNRPDNLTAVLDNLTDYGAQAAANLTELEKELSLINFEIIPEAYQKQFIVLKQKTAALSFGLNEFLSLAGDLKNFLGLSADKRYLLVFQNNSELRASGGFIGSFATVDFSRGQIKNITAPGGGSYDTDAGLARKIKSPEPLSLVRPDWHFWDANWWPDWPATADKLAWFYENSDGSTVDGVIGLTPSVMERLLKVIGPVDLRAEYGLVFEADNFWLETQKLAEQKANVTLKPKKIIGDLLNKIIAELPSRLNKSNLPALLSVMEESLSDKNILFYFTDRELQNKAAAYGWDGRIKNTPSDYLNVVNTNIAGGKSDRKINQVITHQADIAADGAIIDTVTIKRTHLGINREPFSGVRNVDWLRIYVPAGSQLISAEGFKPVDKIFFKSADPSWPDDPRVFASEGQARIDELTGTKIYEEFNKTVFANWSQLDPGETAEIKLVYRLPFKLTDRPAASASNWLSGLLAGADQALNAGGKNFYSYSLLTQKQPGMNASIINSRLKLNGNFKAVWNYPDNLKLTDSGWTVEKKLDHDELTAVLLTDQ